MEGRADIMTELQRIQTTARQLRTVAIVSSHPEDHVLETLLGAVDHDVVFVESSRNAYSRIRQVKPDLIILCLSPDDVHGCHLLSMLTLDRETSGIPVRACMPPPLDGRFDEGSRGATRTAPAWVH